MMEGSVVTVPAKGSAVEGPGSPPSEGRSRTGQRNANLGPRRFLRNWFTHADSSSAKPDMYQIDTSNVLFILSGAFVGLDTVIKRRVAKGVSQTVCRDALIHTYLLQSIGFTAELGSNDDTPSSDFMPFFTPNRRPLLNMLEHVEPAGEIASRTYNDTMF